MKINKDKALKWIVSSVAFFAFMVIIYSIKFHIDEIAQVNPDKIYFRDNVIYPIAPMPAIDEAFSKLKQLGCSNININATIDGDQFGYWSSTNKSTAPLR